MASTLRRREPSLAIRIVSVTTSEKRSYIWLPCCKHLVDTDLVIRLRGRIDFDSLVEVRVRPSSEFPVILSLELSQRRFKGSYGEDQSGTISVSKMAEMIREPIVPALWKCGLLIDFYRMPPR